MIWQILINYKKARPVYHPNNGEKMHDWRVLHPVRLASVES